jgi:hypothetical protein
MRLPRRFLLFASAVVLSSTAAVGATWVVDPTGQGDFTSIKLAINAASMFDTILVRPGNYQEELRIIAGHSGMVLRGDGAAADVVVQADTLAVGIWDTDPAVRLENLTISGGDMFGGIRTQSARAEIRGCVITANNGPGGCHGVGGGVQAVSGSDILIEGCTIEENHGWESPGGVIIWSSRADIRGNVFRNNSACYGGAIEMYHCEGSGVSVIEDNLFVGNTADVWGGGMFNVDSSPVVRRNTFVANGATVKPAIWVLGGKPEIDHNIIAGSELAVYCFAYTGYPPSLPVIGENICWSIADTAITNCDPSADPLIVDPLFCDSLAGDFRVCADSPAVLGEELIFGALGVGCPKCGDTPVKPASWGFLKSLFDDSRRR